MKYLKTYEGLFDFFRKKEVKPQFDKELAEADERFLKENLDVVKECFIELVDELELSIQCDVEFNHEDNRWETCVLFRPIENVNYSTKGRKLKLQDLIENFHFVESYLDEMGMKVESWDLAIFGYFKEAIRIATGNEKKYHGYQKHQNLSELDSKLKSEAYNYINSVRIIITKIH